MEQCVMIIGTMKMPLLPALNLDSLVMVNLLSNCNPLVINCKVIIIMWGKIAHQFTFIYKYIGAVVLPSGSFEGALPNVLSDVACTGNENSLLNCSGNTIAVECVSGEGAAIVCQSKT